MNAFKQLMLSAALLGASFAAMADIVVVAHPSLKDASVSKEDVAKIFLGKSNKLPSGTSVIPIDQENDSPARVAFHDEVTDKNPSQLTAYWSRLVFTGKGQPPKTVMDDEEVKDLVANNPNIIGYIDKASVDGTVKVIYTAK
jgi:ABC-type phosphate transport system substrate-binding protein